MTSPSPLVGYNNNVRHKSKLYHIQTEDSGIKHPHIITHLFADGGRIIASKKTDYAQYLGSENLHEIVKKLMQEQHKAMFIALRDCVYDEDEAGPQQPAADAPTDKMAEPETSSLPELDLDALERAAELMLAKSAAAKTRRNTAQRGTGRYKQTVATRTKSEHPSKLAKGTELQHAKSLDEVILSYLADDSSDEK